MSSPPPRMGTPIINLAQEQEAQITNIVSGLIDTLRNPNLADLAFLCYDAMSDPRNSATVWAHQALFSNASLFIQDLCDISTKQRPGEVAYISCPGINATVMQKVVDLVYTGQVKCNDMLQKLAVEETIMHFSMNILFQERTDPAPNSKKSKRGRPSKDKSQNGATGGSEGTPKPRKGRLSKNKSIDEGEDTESNPNLSKPQKDDQTPKSHIIKVKVAKRCSSEIEPISSNTKKKKSKKTHECDTAENMPSIERSDQVSEAKKGHLLDTDNSENVTKHNSVSITKKKMKKKYAKRSVENVVEEDPISTSTEEKELEESTEGITADVDSASITEQGGTLAPNGFDPQKGHFFPACKCGAVLLSDNARNNHRMKCAKKPSGPETPKRPKKLVKCSLCPLLCKPIQLRQHVIDRHCRTDLLNERLPKKAPFPCPECGREHVFQCFLARHYVGVHMEKFLELGIVSAEDFQGIPFEHPSSL